MERFAMGRSHAYARLLRLVAEGLLEQRTLLYRQPGLYIATVEGLRWCRLERVGVYRVGLGAFQHARETATAVITLHRCFSASWHRRRISSPQDSKSWLRSLRQTVKMSSDVSAWT
jgi:hypothetical protein